ncbi:MAG TPA: hypothetical protein VJ969_04100, partial [Desulfopila sp.]|nr:hypothetical protein [Desulfopila sp.]
IEFFSTAALFAFSPVKKRHRRALRRFFAVARACSFFNCSATIGQGQLITACRDATTDPRSPHERPIIGKKYRRRHGIARCVIP